jgi:ankyrin repeat protein
VVVKKLLAAGASVNMLSDVRISLLPSRPLEARPSGDYAAHLAGRGRCGVQTGVTPLFIAARNGHIVVTKKLLAAGANPNIQCEVHTSPALSRHARQRLLCSLGTR